MSLRSNSGTSYLSGLFDSMAEESAIRNKINLEDLNTELKKARLKNSLEIAKASKKYIDSLTSYNLTDEEDKKVKEILGE